MRQRRQSEQRLGMWLASRLCSVVSLPTALPAPATHLVNGHADMPDAVSERSSVLHTLQAADTTQPQASDSQPAHHLPDITH